MTRPLQRGDIVRSRRSGRIGEIDWIGETGPLCVIRPTRPTDIVWFEIVDLELYDEDSLVRPIRRLLAGIAMAAALKVGWSAAARRAIVPPPPVGDHWGEADR